MTNQDGFTPKEKAKELVDKIFALNYAEFAVQENHPDKRLKSLNTAILLCDEIIKYEFFGSYTAQYWAKVKVELEKTK